MRRASGILLWVVATASGVFGAGWLSLAGVGWSSGFVKRSYWDESESGIGVGFAVVALLIWLGLLVASFTVIRGGDAPPTRAARVTSILLTGVSVMVVIVLCGLSIGWPEPPSEYPTPPWNRA